ncbi:hypothetical protein [Polaribacter sp. P097]|uniref:hypothetical protein n=1 Tax=Polaribacter sp. P097 TaxID=3117398 RepID=UPI002FE12D0B
MRKSLIILVSLIVTALNINSYGDLSESQIEKAKSSIKAENEVTLDESVNMGLSLTFLKIIHIAELMCVSEMDRKSLVRPFTA